MMNLKNTFSVIKKRWLSILFYAAILIFIFSPSAKSWLLQQVISTGLLKAEIKQDSTKDLQEAPAFSFSDANGKITNTKNLKGKVLFINFWASWCPPCRAEMPSLENLSQKLKDDNNLVFLFLNEDEDKNKAKKYLDKNHFSIPLNYASAIIPKEIYSGSLPTTIVIDKEGKIVLKHEGIAGYNTENFIKQLKSLSK